MKILLSLFAFVFMYFFTPGQHTEQSLREKADSTHSTQQIKKIRHSLKKHSGSSSLKKDSVVKAKPDKTQVKKDTISKKRPVMAFPADTTQHFHKSASKKDTIY